MSQFVNFLSQIQKLYGRCLRAESFRKALIYQKKYLLFLLGGFQETEAITLSMIAKMDDIGRTNNTAKTQYGKSRAFMRFRTAARVVVATWRMKFLVKKWNKSVSKAGGKSSRRSGDSKTSPSAPPDAATEKILPVDRFVFPPKQTGFGHQRVEERTSDNRSSESLRSRPLSERSSESSHSDVMSYKKSRRNGYESQSKRPTENGNLRPSSRKTTNVPDQDQPSYSSVRIIDRSPPRAYPRPASPRLTRRDSPPVLDTDVYVNGRASQHSSRVRSPMSQGSSPHNAEGSSHRRSLSANGLEETNTSLNAYIKKLESLQARLKSQ